MNSEFAKENEAEFYNVFSGEYRTPNIATDWQSATQQAGSLRYGGGGTQIGQTFYNGFTHSIDGKGKMMRRE